MNKITKFATALVAVVTFVGLLSFVPQTPAQAKKPAATQSKRERVKNAPKVKVQNAYLGDSASAVDLNFYVNAPWDKFQRGRGQGVNGLVILNVDPQVKGGLWYYKDHPDQLPAGFTIEQLTLKDTGPEGILCGDMLSGNVRFYGYMCVDLNVSAGSDANGKPNAIYVLKYKGHIVAVVNCGNAFNPYVPEPNCPETEKCVPDGEDTWIVVTEMDRRDKDGYGVYWERDKCGNLHKFTNPRPVPDKPCVPDGEDSWVIVPDKDSRDKNGFGVFYKRDDCGNLHRFEKTAPQIKCLGGYIFAEGGEDINGNPIRGFEKGWNNNGKLGKRFKVEDALNEAGFPQEIKDAVRSQITLKKAAWMEVGVNPCDTRDIRVRFFDKGGRSWVRDLVLFGAGFGAGLLVDMIFDQGGLKKTTNGLPIKIQPPGKAAGDAGAAGGGSITDSIFGKRPGG